MAYLVTNGGEALRVENEDELANVCKALVEKHGPTGLKIETADDEPTPTPEPASAVRAAPAVQVVPTVEAGLARLTRDQENAAAAGFAMKQPLFALGTRVNDTGVDNARRSRIEWSEQPTVQAACSMLVQQVEREERRDVAVSIGELTMDPNGWLRSGRRTIPLNDRAFTSFVARLGCGGAQYLSDACWPELRATNINAQLDAFRDGERREHAEWQRDVQRHGFRAASKEPKMKEVVLRTRNNASVEKVGREVFALVSDKYQSGFGVDRIAAAVGAAIPDDARGSIDYDGSRMKVNALWHSDVQAEDYRAGEVFKAGIIVRADDTGAGGIGISACVWRNLCLNLIVIDQAEQKIASLRHIGSLHKLQLEFERAFRVALKKVEMFRKVWGYATSENLVDEVREVYPETTGVTLQDLIPGIFSAVIEREKVPVRARRSDAVPLLVRKFQKDEIDRQHGFTRAALVNAFTRYAHEELSDPFQQEELERSASALLYPKAGRKSLDVVPWQPWVG